MALDTKWVGALLMVALLFAGCATTDTAVTGEETPSAKKPSPDNSAQKRSPALTVNGAEYDSLGSLVRGIGETADGGGIVLLLGLEDGPVNPIEITNAPYASGIKQLTKSSTTRVAAAPYYQFIYQEGYEALLALNLGEQVAGPFQENVHTFAVGARTDMYNALALLTEALGVTVVADYLIADVLCGELFMHDAPAVAIVEALLKSALVVPEAFVVETSATHMFIRSTSNVAPMDTCLNRGSLSPEATAFLARKVNIYVPARSGELRFQREAPELQSLLDDLSEQIGVTVTATADTKTIPLNQAAYLNMSVSDVLNLIVRQWPVAQFGFRASATGIEFCRLGTA